MLSIQTLVDSAAESTKTCLEALRTSGQGVDRHVATSIQLPEVPPRLVDETQWLVVTCQLPPHLKLRQDTGACLLTHDEPGRKIPVHILTYDWRSGSAELAAESRPKGERGHLVIDYTWLVERCHIWLQTNGTCLKNPFHLQPLEIPEKFGALKEALSDEQRSAAECLLTNPVTYVWGPPGTGKTRYVLAHAVVTLVHSGKKILVTAPTNLAVDHALDAILSLGKVSDLQVLRIGEPTEEFFEKWPDCCEQRIFERQWEDLKYQIAENQRKIEASRSLSQIVAQINSSEEDLARLKQEVVGIQVERQCKERLLEEARRRERDMEEKAGKLRQNIVFLEESIAFLGVQELQTAVRHLEAEHVALVSAKQRAENEMARLSFWSRFFTSKKKRLLEQLDICMSRLTAVEATLQQQRAELYTAGVEEERLMLEADPLRIEEEEILATRNEARLVAHSLTVECRTLLKRIAALHKRLQKTETQKNAAEKEAEQIRNQKGFSPLSEIEVEFMEAEIGKLRGRLRVIEQNVSEKSVLGMTLDGFIGYTMQRTLRFDHVFLDEAAYAPLAKALPLLILGCPIAMLGDHLQLPPICEVSNDALAESYWRTPALYLEHAFEEGVGNHPCAFVQRAANPPDFYQLQKRSLTRSFRFGPRLAGLLDKHVYRNGLQGVAEDDTGIKWIACPPMQIAGQERRVNIGEVEMIVDAVRHWLNWSTNMDETLAILTPYKNQVKALLQRLRSEFGKNPGFEKIDVLTVHRSQGREWDTVFFSASDTERLPTNSPFLADTLESEGRRVVNTAISRARKHLRFFLDDEFWRSRRPSNSMLTDVVSTFPRSQKREA